MCQHRTSQRDHYLLVSSGGTAGRGLHANYTKLTALEIRQLHRFRALPEKISIVFNPLRAPIQYDAAVAERPEALKAVPAAFSFTARNDSDSLTCIVVNQIEANRRTAV